MPTKYDVFAELIEHAPCKARNLPFDTRISSHLNALIKLGWIKKTRGNYVPIKNSETENAFKIIKYCLKNGLNYNKFFSKNIVILIKTLFENAPNLRPISLRGNNDYVELFHYLEKNQFILLIKKRPRKGVVLKHQLFDEIMGLKGLKNNLRTSTYFDIKKDVVKLEVDPVNPFDDKVFSFLSSSAQLEGSTITVGETRELLVNDIYPDKPQKDIQMVKNLNEAMHYVLDHIDEEINEEHVKEVNRLVMFALHRNAGKYKKTHNKIQGNPDFKTAKPELVPKLMQEYCEQLQKISSKKQGLCQAGYIHNEIQQIHPFADGNSRTTRMLLNWILLKYRVPLLVIKMGCFDEYMNLTKLAKKRNDEKLTQLFHHLLLHESLMN